MKYKKRLFVCIFNDAVNIFDYIESNANIDIIYWIAMGNLLVQISSLLPRNLTGTAETTAKTLKVACLREQTEIFWTRSNSAYSVLRTRFYLCNFGRKTQGWLLFASIRNAVTSGGLVAARSNSRTATTAETAGGWRQFSSNSRTATTAETAGGWRQFSSNSRTATTAETAGGWRQLSSNSRTATEADVLATEYQLRWGVDRHKSALELLSV